MFLFVFFEECPLDNTYVCLINHSTNKYINISGWIIKRHVDLTLEYEYKLPDGIHLPPGGELKIYSTLGNAAAQFSSNYESVCSSLHQKLIINDLLSWSKLMSTKI